MAGIVADISPGAYDGVQTAPSSYTVLNNELYFFGSVAPVNSSNRSLNIYKATPGRAGATVVATLNSAAGADPTSLTASGGRLYFARTTGTTGRELWSCDPAGQVSLVSDINQGAGSSSPDHLVDVNGTLYFVADNGKNGRELWRTNGTDGGTKMAKDIWTGTGAWPSIDNLTPVGSKLYFTAYDSGGFGLWVSNGTSDGTKRLTSLDDFPKSYLTNVAGTLYFAGKDSKAQFTTELWRSDGTVAGTYLAADLSQRTGATPEQLTAVGNKLYFSAAVPETQMGRELYVYDTVTRTSKLVKNIADDLPQVGAAYSSNPADLRAVNGLLYFSAANNSSVNNVPVGQGRELYVSDGTSAGTHLIKDIKPGRADSNPRDFVFANNLIYFTADDGVTGRELWQTDGTSAGTRCLQDINPGADGGRTPYSSDPQNLTQAGGILYFSALGAGTGRELWAEPSVTAADDQYLSGDWNGDGKDELAVRRGSVVYFQNKLADGVASRTVSFGNGNSEDQYLVGDWNGDGKDELAVRRGSTLYFQSTVGDSTAAWTVNFGNGNSENQYLVGDWNGDRKDEIAVRRGSTLYCQGKLSDTTASRIVTYGNGTTEDQYLVGDWNGDGKDELAVRRGFTLYCQSSLSDNTASRIVNYGNGKSEDQYLVGDWTGNGTNELAVRRKNAILCQDSLASAAAAIVVRFGNGTS